VTPLAFSLSLSLFLSLSLSLSLLLSSSLSFALSLSLLSLYGRLRDSSRAPAEACGAPLASRPSQPCLASANPGEQRAPACPADPALHAGTAGQARRIGVSYVSLQGYLA
jgi:hypothetical protein